MLSDVRTNTTINQWKLGKYINETENNLLVCCRIYKTDVFND